MAHGDSSLGGGVNAQFDFNSNAGVLVVLSAIRGSTLSMSERNELRDLVFSYSNGGGDPAIKTLLEERLAALGITPESAVAKVSVKEELTAVATPRYAPGFASGRPTPVFVAGTLTPQPAAAPVVITRTPPVAPAPIVPSASAPIPTPTPETNNIELRKPTPATVVVPPIPPRLVPSPASVREVVTIKPPVRLSVQSDVVPVPLPVPVPPITPVMPLQRSVPVISVTPASETPTAPAAAPASAPAADTSPATAVRLERIRQIKSEVNSQVGNPVNLVEINPTVGREYMTALLEAMKLLSSAGEAESERAMARLETVYVEVQKIIAGNTTTAPAAPPVSAPVPMPDRAPYLPVAPVVPMEPLPPVPVVPTASVWQETQTAPVPRVAEQISVPLPPTPTPTPTSSPLQSVAAASIPLRSLSELPTAADVNSATAGGNPLLTKEVDAGLNQLLSEWAIFKKSGLFGTGPGGTLHPLFTKIGPMLIPLILAGRFEGATQEIKQSITDYMNGWRYEQGIVYEKDETFEHYLRRVIRHIIDLQNKKRGT